MSDLDEACDIIERPLHPSFTWKYGQTVDEWNRSIDKSQEDVDRANEFLKRVRESE